MEVNWVTTLIIGSLLSIPLSILANIMTPTFQKWFNKRTRTARTKSLADLKKEYEQTKTFKEQPAVFQFATNEYLIKGMIVLCLLALGTSYFALFYAVDSLSNVFSFLQTDIIKLLLALISAVVWLLMLVFMASMINGLLDLWVKYSRIKQFEKYEKEILAKIQEIEKNIVN